MIPLMFEGKNSAFLVLMMLNRNCLLMVSTYLIANQVWQVLIQQRVSECITERLVTVNSIILGTLTILTSEFVKTL